MSQKIETITIFNHDRLCGDMTIEKLKTDKYEINK
jgi:hypothetical protein